MLRFLLFFTLLISSLYANDKVEIYATTMKSQEQIVNASGEVVVVYKDYVLSANKAIYDKSTGELELFDNIRATQGNDYKILGNYAKLNIAKKERLFKPFYMLEKKSEVWMSGSEGLDKNNIITTESGVVSSCNPVNPLWKMEYTTSEYNSESKWLNLYNTRIYIYDIPVFYTPYFGYSLDTTRRTGLLPPAIGLSDKEGFYYEQPIYIAESNWWDLELKPQIRTNRGAGIYSTFRFVDSPISHGYLTAGYFKEQDTYFQENNLANDKHYGFNFRYDNSDVINQWFGSSLEGQSGLYIDINSMNDVDYINLSTNDVSQNNIATQVLSRINMFYNTDDNYFGAYFKYYRDLTINSNDETLQKLPTLQYHSYLDTLFDEHLLYSLDIKSNYLHRTLGKTALQTDVNIPITLQTSLFDEYVNISYTSYLYAQHSSFSGDENTDTEYNNGYYARNYHSFTISTQQTKAYDELIHVIDLGAEYVIGGTETEDGYYEDQRDRCTDPIHEDEAICEFYNISDIEENLQLYFSQYVYGDDGKQIIYHRLAQNISYEKSNSKVGELENEFDYQITSNLNFYNNMFYNFDENSFSKNFNQITYNTKGTTLALSHMYQNRFLVAPTAINSGKTSYMTSRLTYDYNEHYSYSFRYDYDLENSIRKAAEIGFLYKKKCWDFGIRYVENNRPILTNTGALDSIYDRYIYFTITLKPMMQSNRTSDFGYRLPGDRR